MFTMRDLESARMVSFPEKRYLRRRDRGRRGEGCAARAPASHAPAPPSILERQGTLRYSCPRSEASAPIASSTPSTTATTTTQRPIPAWQCARHSATLASQWWAESSVLPPLGARGHAHQTAEDLSACALFTLWPARVQVRVSMGSGLLDCLSERRVPRTF